MSGYISQSAVEYDGLSLKAQGQMRADWRESYLYQLKYDGVSGVVFTGPVDSPLVDKTVPIGFMKSRTNEFCYSCDHIVAECRRIFGPNRVVFGEVYKRGWEQPEISGAFRRQSPQPELEFVVFDMVTQDEFFANLSPRIYSERHLEYSQGLRQGDSAVVSGAETRLPQHTTETDVATYAAHAGGYDGYIRRDPRATWTPGRDKRGVVLKFKPTVTFDLECIGVEEGKGKYKGTLGALLLRFRDGKVVKASGMSDKHRAEWWAEPPIGSIHEIEAMAVSTKGLLREPRWKGQRFDKLKPDF